MALEEWRAVDVEGVSRCRSERSAAEADAVALLLEGEGTGEVERRTVTEWQLCEVSTQEARERAAEAAEAAQAPPALALAPTDA